MEELELELKLPLVSFELGMKLKEKGFNVHQDECWVLNDDTKDAIAAWTGLIGDGYTFACFRPTLELAKMWFRVVHKIELRCLCMNGENDWDCGINRTNRIEPNSNTQMGDSYEEALEEGLLKACDLIEKL